MEQKNAHHISGRRLIYSCSTYKKSYSLLEEEENICGACGKEAHAQIIDTCASELIGVRLF